MCEQIVIATYGKKGKELREILSCLYSNIEIVFVENLETLNNMSMLETPDVIFLYDNEISNEVINKMKIIDKGVSPAIFCVAKNTGKGFAYFDSNILYNISEFRYDSNEFRYDGSKYDTSKYNSIPSRSVVDTIAKMIRRNKNQMSLSDDIVDFEDVQIYLDMINLWDSYTKGHCLRTQKYVDYIMSELKLSDEDKFTISNAALLHDIGKISIKKSILTKMDKLTDEEYAIIKTHALSSSRYLPGAQFNAIRPLIVSHHENYDGRGYPYNLSKDDVPYGSYIIGLADAFDAMTTPRGYNKVKNLQQAKCEIEKFSGRQFHPEIAAKFIELIERPNFNAFYKENLANSHKQKVLVYKNVD